MKKIRWEVIYSILAIIFTFFVVSSGEFFGKTLNIEVGQIATETIVAPFEDENEVATEKKRKQAEAAIPDIYKMDETILEKGIVNIELLFNYSETVKNSGIPEQYNVNPLELLQKRSPIPLYEDEYKALLAASVNELHTIEQICVNILTNVMEEGVKQEENRTLEIRTKLEKTTLNNIQQKIAYEIIQSQIKPNIVVDKEATAAAKEEARNMVEPVHILQGEKIIEKGNRITEEAYAILNRMGYLNTDIKKDYTQYLGLGVLIVLMSFFLYKSYQGEKPFKSYGTGQMSLVFILYLVSLGLIRLMINGDFIFVPLAVAPILIAILIQKDLAILMQLILLVVAALTHKADILFMMYHLLSGLMSILIMSHMQERKQTMKNAIMVGGIQMIIFITLNLLVGVGISTTLFIKGVQAFIVGVVVVILVVGSLPLWEAAFGFITPMQLLELTNPNQPILKKLLLEATGTYYHSLLVANLAEAAASEIGAHPLMARVGGYYHDIGKLTCTTYFKENQVLENPHDYLEPKTSADIILSHVSSGIELADEYKLPKCIKDFIKEHHGTSTIAFFYAKAQKQEGLSVNSEDFTYKGPKPQTKETALVMLADIVEATVRAMQHKIGKEVTVEELVRKMVKGKLEEGQLDECPLYISDIEKIINSFTRMLKGMYHERIEYPERKGQ